MMSSLASTSNSPSPPVAVDDEEHCIICLQNIIDRTLLPECGHKYTCFQCICAWITSGSNSLNSRRCPLCNTPIGTHLIHNLRGEHDFQKHWLPPVNTEAAADKGSTLPRQFLGRVPQGTLAENRHRRNIRWGKRPAKGLDELEDLEKAIERRRHIYRRNLFAKHVASNRHTRYKPYPSPAQIAASQDLCSRILKFVRRELRVWEGLDIEFLTQYIISLLRTMDLRSERAIALLGEFLDSQDVWIPDPLPTSRTIRAPSRRVCNAMTTHPSEDKTEPRHRHIHAEHFAHELYTYLRSPFTDLAMWDRTIQYDNIDQPTMGSSSKTKPLLDESTGPDSVIIHAS